MNEPLYSRSHRGFVPRGKGGGDDTEWVSLTGWACMPGFFGGGGGGGGFRRFNVSNSGWFLIGEDWSFAYGGGRGCRGDCCCCCWCWTGCGCWLGYAGDFWSSTKLLNRLEIPYFWSIPLIFFFPDSIWSLWRSRKLRTVDVALLASLGDTEVGSLWKDRAVLKAAFFCSVLVPCEGLWEAGEEGLEEETFILENRAWSSFWGAASDPWDVLVPPPLDLLIPRLGTDTPALPSRFIAPWFIVGTTLLDVGS